MINSSIILSVFIKIYIYLSKLYKDSMFSRLVEYTSKKIFILFENSKFVRFFIDDYKYSSSNTSKIIIFINKIIEKIRILFKKRITPLLEESLVFKLYNKFDIPFISSLILISSMIFLPTKLSMIISMGIIFIFIYETLSKKREWNKSIIYLLISFMIIMIIENVINAINLNNASMIAAIYLLYLIVSVVISKMIVTKKQVMAIVYTILTILFISSLYGLYQYIVGAEMDSAWIDEEIFDTLKTRVYSFFGNPNVFGLFLILTLPFAFAMGVITKKYFMKAIYFGLFLFGIVNIAMTFSRGSLIGMTIAIIIMLLFMDKRFIGLGIMSLPLLPFIMPQSLINRIMSIGNLQESSSAYRISIYMASIDMIKDFFYSGIGIGGFNDVYFAYAYSASKSFHAHNTFLMVLIELGIVGFVIFMSILILFSKEIISGFFITDNKVYKMLMIASLSGVVGSSVQGLVEHIWHNYDILFFYWFIMTFGLAISSIAKRESRNL